MKKARVATYLANFFDHFDTAIYGFLVPIIAPMFFPKSDPMIALIQGYGVVIVGLVTRPLGAWYYSKKAQRDGPQLALINTIQGMTITTFCFVFLDTYENWGIYGALGLCALRGLQSFFGSGEVSIAGLYVLEGSDPSKQHQITSMYLSSQMAGILLAGGIASIIFYSNSPQLYWKWPFYGSLITSASGWWLRKQQIPKFLPKPTTKHTKHNWNGIFRVAFVSGFSYVLYSASFLFFNSLSALLTKTPIAKIMASNAALIIFDLSLLIILGRLFRILDCKPLLKKIITTSIILIPTLFLLLPHLEFLGICIARILMITIGVAFCIPMHRWYMEEFPTNNRYKTTAIGYAIGSETIGRTFPTVGMALWYYTNSTIAPGIYIALIGTLALMSLSNTAHEKK
jgi:MHS family proline/betaine transporter-like MFS transporter